MPSCTLRSATEAVPRGPNVYMPGVSAQGGAGLGAGDPQGARGGESCALAWLATCTSARRHLSREHTHGAPPVLQMKDKVAFYAMKTARTMFDTVTGCVAQRAPPTGGGFWHASLRKCWAANQLFGCTSPSHTGRRNPPFYRYGHNMTEKKWLTRMIFLETVAGVPVRVCWWDSRQTLHKRPHLTSNRDTAPRCNCAP